MRSYRFPLVARQTLAGKVFLVSCSLRVARGVDANVDDDVGELGYDRRVSSLVSRTNSRKEIDSIAFLEW